MAVELKMEDSSKVTGLIPESASERERIRTLIDSFLKSEELCPPLSLKQMEELTVKVSKTYNIHRKYSNFITILISNSIWRESFSRVPYNRRILILPQCLKSLNCKAEMDEFGILCESCGACVIGPILEKAESLGYLTLVAEGSTIVTSLIEKDQVDAVIGVSCISALEKSFPYTASTAVPAIALPLVVDGCKSTSFDTTWIDEYVEYIGNYSGEQDVKPNQLREETEDIFKRDNLSTHIEQTGSFTEKIACDWLGEAGKRWRPFLYLSICRALNPAIKSEDIEKIAVAIECFHKASLIHDDIEDDDNERYGKPTLHKLYGIPVALNAGDLLLGEGYRLISESSFPKEIKADMLHEASENHRNLCLGQGDELDLMHNGGDISIERVLNIFRNKTSPAFQVALVLGAICCEEDRDLINILKEFSHYLGIAYQIKDDIEDSMAETGNDLAANRPSLIRAMWYEKYGKTSPSVEPVAKDYEADAWEMFEKYRNLALDATTPLKNLKLKSLLFKIVYKVLGKEINRESVKVDQNV